MATKKSGKNGTGGEAKGEAYDKSSRCWPGFTPVPGKGEHEEGSCRKLPASKNGGKEVNRETARKKQISLGGKRAEQAKGKSPDSAERKSVSKAARDGQAGKTAPAPAKKTAAKKAPAKTSAAKNSAARKGAAASGKGKRVVGKAPAKRTPAKRAPRTAAKKAPRKSAARRG